MPKEFNDIRIDLQMEAWAPPPAAGLLFAGVIPPSSTSRNFFENSNLPCAPSLVLARRAPNRVFLARAGPASVCWVGVIGHECVCATRTIMEKQNNKATDSQNRHPIQALLGCIILIVLFSTSLLIRSTFQSVFNRTSASMCTPTAECHDTSHTMNNHYSRTLVFVDCVNTSLSEAPGQACVSLQERDSTRLQGKREL